MFFDGHWMPAVHGLGWWWLVLLLLAVVVGLLVGAQRRDGGTRETPRQVLQRRLATEWTGLDAELLQRADGEAPGRATLMEVYRRTGGIDASIEAAIAAAAAEALAGIPAGPRHVEVFAPAGD